MNELERLDRQIRIAKVVLKVAVTIVLLGLGFIGMGLITLWLGITH